VDKVCSSCTVVAELNTIWNLWKTQIT
jgi:hypothetical protein